LRVGVLGLIRLTRGGVTLEDILDMPHDDFDDWAEAAAELERRITSKS
jgi:hypothetical protein